MLFSIFIIIILHYIDYTLEKSTYHILPVLREDTKVLSQLNLKLDSILGWGFSDTYNRCFMFLLTDITIYVHMCVKNNFSLARSTLNLPAETVYNYWKIICTPYNLKDGETICSR